MVIVSRFESTCPNCNRRIAEGTNVNWSRGTKATHVECPQPSPEETIQDQATGVVDAATRTQNLIDSTRLLTAIVNGDASGNAVVAQAALDMIEDRLFSEYELTKGYVAGSKVTDQYGNVRDEPVAAPAAALPKGIYRVSLTGTEKRYGADHVNVQVIPNTKYQNLKVGEWHGESIGTYSVARGFRYWPSVDATGARTLAIRAAFEILVGSADPIEYARAYAVESSTCWRCGADLVDEKSRERLLGPECFKLTNRAS